jgi:carboxymethylenebutenolidase
MGTLIKLSASDGHSFSAYRADPQGKPRGGVLVIQEIFGVNAHVRAVCDDYAKEGFVAIAPALFDRIEAGVELGYEGEDMRRGVAIVMQVKPRDALLDMQATVDELAKAGKVGVVGYCYGGTMAWAAASRLERVAAASCYYGGQLARQKDVTLKAPVILHFGEQDAAIPLTDVEAVRGAHPSVPIYMYPAGHGFNCDQRASYHKESAALAKARTLELFNRELAA